MKPDSTNTVILVPAFNEEECIGGLIEEIRTHAPGFTVVVINDGSADRTAARARDRGAKILDLACNLGVGGAVQGGFDYAFRNGYQYAVRLDGDGQHPPSEIPRLLNAMGADGVDLVIGSRFLAAETYRNTFIRNCGINVLARFLSLICRKRVTDPTSGFQMVNRYLLNFFSHSYPMDYPEPEALALMRRQGYDFMEVPTAFRKRTSGRSSIRGWGNLYYVMKVFLALCVDRARAVDPNYDKAQLEAEQ